MVKKGYIRASEMNGPKTLDEAATYDDSSKDIPVYASDGVTVIDTFHIYGPEEVPRLILWLQLLR